MKKPGKQPSGRKRHLSDEDEEVWSHTARTLEPLKKAKSRVHSATEALELALAADVGNARQHAPAGPKSAPARGNQRMEILERVQQPVPMPSKAPALADFDKRKARKLGTGQIAIDARIDLHGMRQSEAHSALRGFLFSAYAKGHRWVLIVTGKGARQNRDRAEDPWTIVPVEPGVLKRNVPGWLGEPELRAIVISFKTAASRHGGEGALYVHLRNAGRAGQ
jgi:DNA-nicking Smr family endonuclease